jgi:hypothetical protein
MILKINVPDTKALIFLEELQHFTFAEVETLNVKDSLHKKKMPAKKKRAVMKERKEKLLAEIANAYKEVRDGTAQCQDAREFLKSL